MKANQINVKDLKRYLTILESACQKYNIGHLCLQNSTPEFIFSKNLGKQTNTEVHFQDKLFDNNCENSFCWGHFQLKTFAWIAICLGSYVGRNLVQFNAQDIQFLNSLFTAKSREFILYQLKCLIKDGKKSKEKWSEEECQLLTQLMRENQVRHQWSLISYEIFVRSEGRFFRTREKCREQWFNHLAPDIRKGEWNSEEDVLLFSSVIQYGKRWSKISKIFDKTRTEHMVKNRYNAILSKMKKKFKKFKNIDEKILDELKFILEAKRSSYLEEEQPGEKEQNSLLHSSSDGNREEEMQNEEKHEENQVLEEEGRQKPQKEDLKCWNWECMLDLSPMNKDGNHFQVEFFDSKGIQDEEDSFHQFFL